MAPAVERVLLILAHRLLVVPLGVELVAAGTVGRHHQAEHLAEIGGRTLVVRHGLVVEHDGQRGDRVVLAAGQRPGLLHAREHQIAASQRIFGVAHGRIARRGVHHPNKHGSLLDIEVLRLLVEEGVRRRLDAVGIRSVFDRIEVHRGDLLLRIVVLELEGRDPLLELRGDEFGHAGHAAAVAGRIARKEVLGQLLRDGRSAALRGVLHEHGLHRHTGQRGNVDSRMAAEPDILRRDERRDDRRHLTAVEADVERRVGREEVGILHIGAVLHEEGADDLTVLGVDLRRKVAARVLQLLERGHAPEYAERRERKHQGQQDERGEGDRPDPFYRLRADARLLRLCHIPEFWCKDTKNIRTAARASRQSRLRPSKDGSTRA